MARGSFSLRAVAFAIVMVCGVSGCLRYYPSRAELAEADPSQKIAQGPQAFHEHERKQIQRLQALIAARHAEDAGGEEAYHIGVEDLLQFEVFDVPELNKKVRVQPNGEISLPLIGVIEVKGLTEAELEKTVSERLRKFIRVPQVSVFIAEYAAKKVSVIGEVAKPGVYSLKRDNYSLLELLSEAGGRTEKASGEIILIPARSSATGAPQTPVLKTGSNALPSTFGIQVPFDLLTGSSDKLPLQVALRPGDTIVVPEAGRVQVDGEVKKPGTVELASRMTLLGAIAAAGSVNYSADVHSVEVIRETSPGKRAVLTVDLEKLAAGNGKDVRLRDGDVIRVPSDNSRFITRQVIDSINGFLNIGVGGSVNMGG